MSGDSSCHIIENPLIGVRFGCLHNKARGRDAQTFLYTSKLSSKLRFPRRNLHLIPKRVPLEGSYSDPFLTVRGLRAEKGIIRLRKSSAGWPAVPGAEEEHYVGLCCVQANRVISTTSCDWGKIMLATLV